MAFQKGDKVRLIDKFYEHPDFTALTRMGRKCIAELRGKTLEYASTMFNTCRVSMDERGVVWCTNVPPSLLEPVPTERLVKRHALPGERIRIVTAVSTMGKYNNDDVLTVCESDEVAVFVKEFYRCILHDEYRVIEPATPALHTYTPDQIREARDIAYEELFGLWHIGQSNSIHLAQYPGGYTGYQDDADLPYKNRSRTICTRRDTWSKTIVMRTYAFCQHNDEWNDDIGRMVAICKMTGRAMPAWIR